ncbi:MAG TPA: hypothetical protein VFT71_05360 [Candidatus Nitrosocosmicus sp.]|jgi:hypothetical protein|nr:hypothetical protein [Candidatus Nitrosocosmicus sp.]
MDNIINAQTSPKTYLRAVAMLFTIALVLSITLSNAFAVPNRSNDPNTQCQPTGKKSNNGLELVECCWTEKVKPGTGLFGNDFEIYCSECENGGSRGNINCSDPELNYRKAPAVDESIVPNNERKILEQEQPTNPTFNSNKGTISNENLAEDQPMQLSSNNKENQELIETNDADTTSNNQENDASSTSGTTDSEITTNFAKKGNAQNSPVPPECPKQGPIPPDCTMKPKF